MLKAITIIIAAYAVCWFLDSYEPDLTGTYALTPYDRCIEAYSGTAEASQCALLK